VLWEQGVVLICETLSSNIIHAICNADSTASSWTTVCGVLQFAARREITYDAWTHFDEILTFVLSVACCVDKSCLWAQKIPLTLLSLSYGMNWSVSGVKSALSNGWRTLHHI
jgi:hypothetical protein